MSLREEEVLRCLQNGSEPNDIYYDKHVSGNIHQHSGRHFAVQNVRYSNTTAFIW